MKTFGIAYHSPLDLLTLVPNKTRVTLQAQDQADVFFSQDAAQESESPVQIVFASPRLLVSKGIEIIDQGNRGQILNLNKLDWKKILTKG